MQKVVAGPLHGDHMHVRRDEIWRKPVGERALGARIVERAHTVGDVEENAAFPRLPHHRHHLAVRPQRRIGRGTVAMGENVARPQHRDHLRIGRRSVADMRHKRQPDGLRRLQREFQGAEAELACLAAPDPCLHADDAVAVRLDLGDAAVDRQHLAQRRLADAEPLVEAEDPRKRDVEKGEDAIGRMGHHIVAEAVVIAGAGAASVHHGRRRRTPRNKSRIDAERRRLVVDMGVDVDQAGCDDRAADVDDARSVRGKPLADGCDLPRSDRDIGDRVDAVALVEDAAACQHQVMDRGGCRFVHRISPLVSACTGDRSRSPCRFGGDRTQASSIARFSLIDCSAASTMRRLLTAASIASLRSRSSRMALRKKACSRSQSS